MDQITQVEWRPHDGPQYKPSDTWEYWKAVPDHPALGQMGCLFVSGIQGTEKWWWQVRGVVFDRNGHIVTGDVQLSGGMAESSEGAMALAHQALESL